MTARQRLRVVAAAVAVLTALTVLAGCSQSGAPTVKPVKTPGRVDDVTGIWRSPQQGTLELQKNGTYVLITPVSDALAGDYSLSQDRITVFGDSKACGGAQGTYRIQVAYQQRLLFTEPDDPCALRRAQLTADPFVYG